METLCFNGHDRNQEHERRQSSSRKIDCSFEMIAVLDTELNSWTYKIKSSEHNYNFILTSAHSVHRRTVMIEKMKSIIQTQCKINTDIKNILSAIRLNIDSENSLFKTRDVYNQRQSMRQKAMSSDTSIQSLMRKLFRRKNWFMTTRLSIINRMKCFFFAKIFSQDITKLNSKVYLIDCTYKTNQYRMSLCIIIDATFLNIIFYVVFYFLINERMKNYQWMMQQLRCLCDETDVSDFIVVVIDNEKSLIATLFKVFSTTRHLLCLWHINKNVLTNYKIWFDENDEWKKFYAVWQKVIYANTKTASNEIWNAMCLKHEENFLSISYLNDLLRFNREKFFRCFTNRILHFDNTITFRNEFDHAKLKRELRVFTDKNFFISS